MTADTWAIEECIDHGEDEAPAYDPPIGVTARAQLAALQAQAETAERLQHVIDCADTPLMRDVIAERDAAVQAAERLEKDRDTRMLSQFRLQDERDLAVARAEAAEQAAGQWERRAKSEEDQKRTASKAYLDMQAAAKQARDILNGIDYEEGSRLDRAVVILDAALGEMVH